ncbi:unnamed protein product [Clavelina lepadiformis]|uniref:Uncharacterized protein n=1 Tax=Clavelina lepadiformis TaxID=159417 RepID=A0ABP0GQK4_CLALP
MNNLVPCISPVCIKRRAVSFLKVSVIQRSLVRIQFQRAVLDYFTIERHAPRPHGVTVSTQDSESCDPSSNLGGT